MLIIYEGKDSSTIRILIADDHAIVREGIKQILSGTSDIVVAGEARDGNEVMEKLVNDNFDLIILDITMPGKSGLEVLKDIKNHRPRLPVLILSMYPAEQYAERVLKEGASGYISKECAPNELIKAIRQIHKGIKYHCPST
ncbi:MAG: response regulator transcription factor [Nitrospirae bacterium]|nr:response regulator transcription factor [Nitrospirota bacterium]